MVIFWESADILALVCDYNCDFVTFPCGIQGQVWYLIVLIPNLCRPSYFMLEQLLEVSRRTCSIKFTKFYAPDSIRLRVMSSLYESV